MDVVTEMHPALQEVLAAASEKGWHICRWSTLRAAAFAGADAWTELKSWCEENDLDCAICFSQSSRAAEVQFRRRHRARAPAAP